MEKEYHWETRYDYIIAGNELRIAEEKRNKGEEETERMKREMENRILFLASSMNKLVSENKDQPVHIVPQEPPRAMSRELLTKKEPTDILKKPERVHQSLNNLAPKTKSNSLTKNSMDLSSKKDIQIKKNKGI